MMILLNDHDLHIQASNWSKAWLAMTHPILGKYGSGQPSLQQTTATMQCRSLCQMQEQRAIREPLLLMATLIINWFLKDLVSQTYAQLPLGIICLAT